MKYWFLPIVFMITVFLILGCAGEDKLNPDKIPPLKPDLYHHLGDTGDFVDGQPVNYHQGSEIEYNGIDAIQGGEWIQIQWEHLADIDLLVTEVFRFNMEDFEEYEDYLDQGGEEYDFATKIAELEPDEDRFEDHSSQLLGYIWFYYLKVIDVGGNWTKSDTVCYKLAPRAVLVSPLGPVIEDLNSTYFTWELSGGIPASYSRLLIFDEVYNLIWQYTPLDLGDTTVLYAGPDVSGQPIRWRVEAYGNSQDTEPVEGTVYTVYVGSESNEIELLTE